jgi:hypothetical protein
MTKQYTDPFIPQFNLELNMTDPRSQSQSQSQSKNKDSLQNLVVLVPLSDESLDKLKKLCKVVHYHPDGNVPSEVMGEGEVWFTGTSAFPDIVKTVEDVPKARVLQLSSGMSLPRLAPAGKSDGHGHRHGD